MTRYTTALLTPATSAISRMLTKSLMINSLTTMIMTRQANIMVKKNALRWMEGVACLAGY